MIFKYKVLTNDEEQIKGTLEALDQTRAISILQSKGYTILELKQSTGLLNLEVNIFRRVKKKEILIISDQIATLFTAQISALRAFNLVSENIKNNYLKEVMIDIAKKIERGSSIEGAFNSHRDVFGYFYISIIAVGEKSGTLARSFAYLSEHLQRSIAIDTKLRKALTYPIFVIVVFFLVMLFMFTFIVPQISTILLSSGQELPLVTSAIIGFSNFLKDNFILIILVMFSLIGFGLFYRTTEQGRYVFDDFFLNIPLIGRLLKEYYLVRFADNMSVMLSSGVPIVKSIETVETIISNVVYKETISDIAKKVRQGQSLSSSVASHSIIGKDLAQIIKVGEETGQLNNMLKVIARFYQQQLENTIDTTIDLIQPTIIVVLGISVGIFIAAVILPIYSLTSAI